VAFALLIWGGAAALNAVLHRTPPPSAALATGNPGSPTAAKPLECPASCFTAAANQQLIPNYPVLTALGFSQDLYPPGTYDPTTAGALYRASIAGWRANTGTPDVCFFSPANSPINSSIDDADGQLSDIVTFVGTWSDKAQDGFVDVSSRLFPDTASATAYLTDLSNNIQNCHRVEFGPDSNRLVVTVQPAAALAVPDSEAAVGWVRLGLGNNRSRAYVMDIQRGNLVARVRVVTQDGTTTEAKFRSFAMTFAQTQLAQIPLG
jgi:hypothetical protein